MRPCIVIPAFESRRSLPEVIAGLRRELPSLPVFVVDDGSTDGTADAARPHAVVVRHEANRGKGAALRTGFRAALAAGHDVALTVDADGQHPAKSARTIHEAFPDPDAWVLAIRDLRGAGAPKANQVSNAISNFFLSRFAGRVLRDTQCGLRRYPLRAALALDGRADGYAYEGELLLLAAFARATIEQMVVPVVYPPEEERVTHFDSVRDPARIIATVVRTLARKRASMQVCLPPSGAERSTDEAASSGDGSYVR